MVHGQINNHHNEEKRQSDEVEFGKGVEFEILDCCHGGWGYFRQKGLLQLFGEVGWETEHGVYCVF